MPREKEAIVWEGVLFSVLISQANGMRFFKREIALHTRPHGGNPGEVSQKYG